MILRRPHDIADLFRDGRARLQWSQSDLADRVGVTRQWISLVENRKTSVEFDLVVATLRALGYVLHVTMEEIEPMGSPSISPPSPSHERSKRTPLTRDGEVIGTQRTRRPSTARARRADDG